MIYVDRTHLPIATTKLDFSDMRRAMKRKGRIKKGGCSMV